LTPFLLKHLLAFFLLPNSFDHLLLLELVFFLIAQEAAEERAAQSDR
jgi:hypothetical protein